MKQYRQSPPTVFETATDSEVYVDELDDEDPLNVDRFLLKLRLEHYCLAKMYLSMQ